MPSTDRGRRSLTADDVHVHIAELHAILAHHSDHAISLRHLRLGAQGAGVVPELAVRRIGQVHLHDGVAQVVDGGRLILLPLRLHLLGLDDDVAHLLYVLVVHTAQIAIDH